MAKKDEEDGKAEGAPEGASDGPLLDLSDAAVKRMIKLAKKRGFVTYGELNAVLPSEEVNSEQIEDILAMLNEMGINVIENEEAVEGEAEEAVEEDEPEGGELVEAAAPKPVATRTSEPADRTDDPVRMYLREMGTVELLSREGEIAIAKRIEAGREAMIAGLCESPLTFQAIIIWRDELNEGKVFLRDIIDLEATYAGPDAKLPAPVGPDGKPLPPVPGTEYAQPAAVSPPSAPAGATPFKAPGAGADGEEKDPAELAAEADMGKLGHGGGESGGDTGIDGVSALVEQAHSRFNGPVGTASHGSSSSAHRPPHGALHFPLLSIEVECRQQDRQDQ